MSRSHVIVPLASLLAMVTAMPLTAQRLEIAARTQYSPASGTQFRMNDGAWRSWDGNAFSIGMLASYWPLRHFGMEGTVDLRFTRAYETFPGLLLPGPRTVDTSTTQLTASLRLAVRQAFGPRLHLTASLGPAMLRLGDAEYNDWGGTLSPTYLHRIAYGVVGGLAAAYAVSARLSLSVSAEDVAYRLSQKPVTLPIVTPDFEIVSMEAPAWHTLAVSAGLSLRVL